MSKRRIFAALGVAGLVAAGSSALTAGITVPADDVGYGSATISGATIVSLVYNLNATGDNVDSITLVLSGDTSASVASIGFNGGAVVACQAGAFVVNTTYTCDNATANYVRATAGLTSTEVVVN